MLYHGSSLEGLTELKPFISEHGKSYVYFTKSKVIALFYTVRTVEKPYSWYPYGFNDKGVPVYTEYYPEATQDIYKGKKGYIYVCDDIEETENPTEINSVVVSEKTSVVKGCEYIEDVYETMLSLERKGELIIDRYDLSRKAWVNDVMSKEIDEHDLRGNPKCDYARFIAEHFPEVWNMNVK